MNYNNEDDHNNNPQNEDQNKDALTELDYEDNKMEIIDDDEAEEEEDDGNLYSTIQEIIQSFMQYNSTFGLNDDIQDRLLSTQINLRDNLFYPNPKSLFVPHKQKEKIESEQNQTEFGRI